MATQDDYIRTALRVPPDLHAQIHESAKENNRTFNAEIVARLRGSFETRDTDIAQDTVGAMLKSLKMTITHAETLAKRLELIEKKRS
jgi:hypothetical protein